MEGGGRVVLSCVDIHHQISFGIREGDARAMRGTLLLVFTRNYARIASPRGPLPGALVTREKGANNKYMNTFFFFLNITSGLISTDRFPLKIKRACSVKP